MEIIQENKYVLGLMSGTSLDGVDLVYVSFDSENNYQIINAVTYSYTAEWLSKLLDVSLIPRGDNRLLKLDVLLGDLFSELIHRFILEFNVKNVDLIASHGHTVHHRPDLGYTLQIGCGKQIFKNTGIVTVSDFRTQDVLLGGQGAPLVPIGDELLFPIYDYCLNLGGFSNVSYNENGVRKAFDICPVNTILNLFSNKLGFEYDDGGNLARKGCLKFNLLEELNNLSFYNTSKPKSLGVEFLKDSILPLLDKYNISELDVLRTFVEHIACQVVRKIPKGTVLLTGGGVYNAFLIERIKKLSSDLNLIIPSDEIVNYKEAVIFALLGKLKIEGKVNCLKSVTGASRDHSSGKVEY